MSQEANGHSQATSHDPVYEELAARSEFAELRLRYRQFIIPATAAFLAWYGLYVLLSMFAGGFMGTHVFGNVNVALIFGLLQFVTTFLIAFVYSRYSNTRLDPLAKKLSDEYYATRER